jgi:hypothetical protein
MIFYDKIQLESTSNKIFNISVDNTDDSLYYTIDANTTKYYFMAGEKITSIPVSTGGSTSLTDAIVINKSIVPNTSGTISLGDETHTFKKIYCNHIYVGNTEDTTFLSGTDFDSLTANSFILPKTSATINKIAWKFNVSTDSKLSLLYSDSSVSVPSNIFTITPNYDASTKAYTNSTININGYLNVNELTCGKIIVPSISITEKLTTGDITAKAITCDSLTINNKPIFTRAEPKTFSNVSASATSLTIYSYDTYHIRCFSIIPNDTSILPIFAIVTDKDGTIKNESDSIEITYNQTTATVTKGNNLTLIVTGYSL